MEISIDIPQKLKIEVAFAWSIPLKGLYPKNLRQVTTEKAAHLYCSSWVMKSALMFVNRWMKKMWFIYTKVSSDITKNKIMLYARK